MQLTARPSLALERHSARIMGFQNTYIAKEGTALLKLAVNAKLPLIEVSTRDVMNFPDVIKFLTKRSIIEWGTGPAEIKPNTLYWLVWHPKLSADFSKLYTKLVMAESTLILINAPKANEVFFQAGEVPVPKEMMMTFINSVVDDLPKSKDLLSSLGGCTIKEAAEAVRLTMSRDKSLTTKGLTLTRKTCFRGGAGLTQIDTNQSYYDPPEELSAYAESEGKFFTTATDWRLIPRGLLADGYPGTGKTEAAKWLAAKWGVPLYRVDIAGAKSKWHGDTEQNVASALSQLDNEEPCMVLFDEIEKVMGGSGGDQSFGDNVTRSLLSQLLWWLAEHRSKVFTVMTTNSIKRLPPELYREGRIDKVMTFRGLPVDQMTSFAKSVLATFPDAAKKVGDLKLQAALKPLKINHTIPGSDPPCVTQTAVTSAVTALVKQVLK